MHATVASAQLESFNPTTGARLGAVPVTAPEDVAAIVDEVALVQPFWAQLTLGDRARYLERAAQVLIDEGDDVRDLIVREQGKPRNEAFTMEVLPTIDALGWIGRAGAEILADEPNPDAAGVPQDQAISVHLRAARGDRGDRAVELPVEHSVRRGGAGADGRQRRRAQAGVADAADRRADRAGVRAGRGARGSRPGRARTRHRSGAGAVARGEDLLHRARSRPVGRSARGARAGSRARCSSSAARTRCSSSPTPTSTTRSRGRSGAALPTPGRRARESSGCT